jgi:hypothetical protein
MHPLKSALLVFAFVTVAAAQSSDLPLSETRLTVHTLLREDVFAGFLGNDLTRFARAERNADTLMEQRPSQRANLLAWKGGMAVYRAVVAHEAGKAAEFQKHYQLARDNFAEAATLADGNDGVGAIIGGTLAVFADRLPVEHRAAAWTLAYDSFSTLWKLQGPGIAQMPVHFRGELLAGLAQSAERTGRSDEAAQYVDKMLTVLAGTPYEATAKRWKDDPAAAKSSSLACKSCHEPRRLAPLVTALSK